MTPPSRQRAARHSSDIAPGAHDLATDDENDEHAEQHGLNAPEPQVLHELSVLKRQVVHNFRSLHDMVQNTNRYLGDTNRRFEEQRMETVRRFEEQRAETNRRFDEQRMDTNRNFDEHKRILGQLTGQLSQLRAQQINKGATYINSPIHPVGQEDGTPIPTTLSNQYKRVHEFLRLKRRNKWPVLAQLLRFYRSDSWPTWGLVSLSPENESDEEEPLAVHKSLEIAISWAPEIALQDLARYLGLEYDKILFNVEEHERSRTGRAEFMKRVTNDEQLPAKRERLELPDQLKAPAPHDDHADKPESIVAPSEQLGWDTRATEDRTPESQRLRVRDVRRYREPTLSPTSVATSDPRLPTHTRA